MTRSPMGSDGLRGWSATGAGAGPPGMGRACSRGRVAAMKPCQISAGAWPPNTRFIELLLSLPTQTAATKPPV